MNTGSERPSSASTSDAYLSAILQATDEAIILTNAEGIITMWNTAAERLYGYAIHEVIGRSLTILCAADHQAEVREGIQRVTHGDPVILDTLSVSRGGWPIDVRLKLTPVLDAQRRLMGLTALVSDMTSHRRTEAILRKNEAWAGLAIEVARLGTWRWTPMRDEILADPRCREICGFDSAAPLQLDTTLQRIHPDDRTRIANALTRAVQINGRGHYTEEFRFVHLDGSVRWVLSRGRAVFVQKGIRSRQWDEPARRAGATDAAESWASLDTQPAAYMLGTILDVTDVMQVEQALRCSKTSARPF